MKYLVKFSDNYADEFDVEGWQLVDEDTKKEFDAALDYLIENWKPTKPDPYNCNQEIEFYFGTNEFLSWSNYKEFGDCFSFKPITNEEEATVIRLFGSRGGGEIPVWKMYEDAESLRDPLETNA